MPKPHKGEKRRDFLDRCMGDPEARKDFPDSKQRYAFCNSQWRRRGKAKEHILIESKAPRDLEDEEARNQLDTIERHLPDSRRRRRIMRRMDILRGNLVIELRKIIGDVMENNLSIDDALRRAKEKMMSIFERCWKIGFEIAGVPDWEMTESQLLMFLDVLDTELGYFRGFLESLEAKMPIDQRVGLYGGGVDFSVWHGWLGTLPSNAEIEWRLTPAEHCADCLLLEAGNPYSLPGRGANPLPTLPRNGDTRCVTNCKCYIISVGRFWSTLINQVGIEVTAIGALEVDPMSTMARAAADLYQELAERYAWHLRMANLGVPGHATAANRAREELAELARQQAHSTRFSVTRQEILAPLDRARSVGLRFVDKGDLTDDLVGLTAIIILMDESKRGEITEVEDGVTVNGVHYRLNAQDKSILFIED